MRLVVIDSGQGCYLPRCLASLESTRSRDIPAPEVIREHGSRGETLGRVLATHPDTDLFIIGDDIVFTPGWSKALERARGRADILGFALRYPESSRIQDAGYDLVFIDGRPVLHPRWRETDCHGVSIPGLRHCDYVNGCAMYLDKKVLRALPAIPDGGMNRWDEFLYQHEAARRGLSIAVIGHWLFHHGRSTKVHADPRLSSESYLVERDIWEDIIRHHLDTSRITRTLHREPSPDLLRLLARPEPLILYGAGTITELLLGPGRLDHSRWTVCSGLPEESGRELCGRWVHDWDALQPAPEARVLITAIGREKEILPRLVPRLEGREAFAVKQTEDGDILRLEVRPLKFFHHPPGSRHEKS